MMCEDERAPVLVEVPTEPKQRRWIVDWSAVALCGDVLLQRPTVVAWLYDGEGENPKLLGDVYVEPSPEFRLNNWQGRVDGDLPAPGWSEVLLVPGIEGARQALRFCQRDVGRALDERARGAA